MSTALQFYLYVDMVINKVPSSNSTQKLGWWYWKKKDEDIQDFNINV